MSMKHRGWALFFTAFFGAIALFTVHVVSLRGDRDDRLAIWAFLTVELLVTARFAHAAITGRIPPWMEEMFDDPG